MDQATRIEDWPPGTDEMAARIRAQNWAATSLGTPDTWPMDVRVVVALMLASPLVSSLAVGPERVLLYNDAAARLYGDRHPRALGHPLPETWPEAYAIAAPLYDRAFAGEAVHVPAQPLDVSEAGGEVFDVYLTPVRSADGAVLAVHMTGFEVEARARTETTRQGAVARSQAAERERLAAMFEQAPGFMTLLSGPDHVFKLVNASYRQLLGHRDMIGLPLREALPEVEGQGFFELMDRVYATGEPFIGRALPISLQRTPGAPVEERILDFIYQPITGEDGTVTGIFVEGTDVTDRARQDAALRASEERYRTLFERMDQGFCLIEMILGEDGRATDYRFVEANPTFERQSGLVGAVGRRIREFAPDLEEHWFERYGRVALTGESMRIEGEVAPLGRWFDINAFRVGAPEQRRVGVLFSDISARRNAEESLRESEERQAFLLRLSDALRAEPSAEAMTNRALQMLLEQMRLDRCYVGIYRLVEDIGDFPHQVHDDRLPPLPTQVRLSDFPKALQVAFDGTLVIDDVVEM
ncbi:MAG TPA: PAS domain-containing protein, partial [Rubellimicrobium sp.]|nr:PAS domain-containing protein [Rubellimicrobium sp.]